MPNSKGQLRQKPSQATVSLMSCFYINILNALVLFPSIFRRASGSRMKPSVCTVSIMHKEKKQKLKKKTYLLNTIYSAVHTCLHCIRAIYLHIKIKKRRVPFNNFYFKGAWPQVVRFLISSILAICFTIKPLCIGNCWD